MTNIDFLVHLHKDLERQGPGSSIETAKALSLIDHYIQDECEILDIGCGTGSQTFVLGKMLKGTITAVDLFQDFLKRLNQNLQSKDMSSHVKILACSMDSLPFEKSKFHLIWSEGAIYIMGFKEGLNYWKQFLKPGGFIVVSEISWFTRSRPKEIEEYWRSEYNQIDSIANKIKVIDESGLVPFAFFKLPEYCWLENYYPPLEKKLDELSRTEQDREILDYIRDTKAEIEKYKKFKDYFGYCFYIARKV